MSCLFVVDFFSFIYILIIRIMFVKWLQFLLVSLFWGATNPLLKKGSAGIELIETTNQFKKLLLQLKWLMTTPSFTLPFILNQCGSVIYYYVVANSDISVAVPAINSLTMVFTALVGRLLGETALSTKTYLGMAMVVGGVCVSMSE